MFVGGGVFKVEKQTGLEWAIAVIVGTGALPISALVKLITRCACTCCKSIDGSPIWKGGSMAWGHHEAQRRL
jgi:hypothetical protein